MLRTYVSERIISLVFLKIREDFLQSQPSEFGYCSHWSCFYFLFKK